MPTSSNKESPKEDTTEDKIEKQHERARELGEVDPETLLLVVTEQMRDMLVHLRALTREVVALRAGLEDKDAEKALTELKKRLDQTSGEEELLRLRSIYDHIEAEGPRKDGQ